MVEDFRFSSLEKEVESLKKSLYTYNERAQSQAITVNNMQNTINSLAKAVQDNTQALKESDERVRTGWNRFFWILGGAFIASMWTWITSGGLSGQ